MGRSGKPCDERDHHGIYYRIQEEYGRTALVGLAYSL